MNLNEDEKEHMHILYSATIISQFLKNNEINTEDPDFIVLLNKLNPSINVLEMVDFELYKEQFDEMLQTYYETERLAVLFKSSFKDVKIGDNINGGIVIGIFTFTIWIYKNPETGHEYCCENCECK